MGKQVPKRTERQQEIYDEVIDRLMLGESANEIEAEYKGEVKAGTLRNWKSQRRKKEEAELARVGDALLRYSEAKALKSLSKNGETLSVTDLAISAESPASLNGNDGNDDEKTRVAARNDELGDQLKNTLLTQANIPSALLASLRDSVGRGLALSNETFLQLFQQLSVAIELGGVASVAIDPETGEETREHRPFTLQQLKIATQTLKDLTKSFADLHLIPHGALSTSPLKFGDSVPPQHLHLHSHGGKKGAPTAIDTIPVQGVKGIKVEEFQEVTDVEWSEGEHEELDRSQVNLLEGM